MAILAAGVQKRACRAASGCGAATGLTQLWLLHLNDAAHIIRFTVLRLIGGQFVFDLRFELRLQVRVMRRGRARLLAYKTFAGITDSQLRIDSISSSGDLLKLTLHLDV